MEPHGAVRCALWVVRRPSLPAPQVIHVGIKKLGLSGSLLVSRE